jgi:flagella basal body P-ring formation protein FlgA
MKTSLAMTILSCAMLCGCYSRPNISEAIAAKHGLLEGVVIQAEDIKVIKIPTTSITAVIPRKRSAVLGHKSLRPIPEGSLIHIPDVSP